MTIDRRRLLRGLGIAAWAAFFDYLWITDEANRYIGERTAWVIPFGGIVLTFTAVAYLLTTRTAGPGETPTRRDVAGVAALLAPVLLIVVIPAPSLGALAVDKKQSNRVSVSSAAAYGRDGPLTLFDVSGASRSPEFARVRGVKAGMPVELIGFVADLGSKGFTMARFQASCCAADAIPYSAKVRPPDETVTGVKVDDWVKAKGTLVVTKDGEFVVQATSYEVIDEPSATYLDS